jgi:hypothetical protein
MPIQNSDIARIVNQVADLLEFNGSNTFPIRVYRNAAHLATMQPAEKTLKRPCKNWPGSFKRCVRNPFPRNCLMLYQVSKRWPEVRLREMSETGLKREKNVRKVF